MKVLDEAKALRSAYLDRIDKDDLILGIYQMKVANVFAESPQIDHRVVESYGAFMRELADQFRYMTDTCGVRVRFDDYDPSKDDTRATAMKENYERDEVLAIFRSQGEHPILDADGIEYNGEFCTFNSIFRAVHDYFGHLASGGEFSWKGETIAYLSHAAMFSHEAKRALFSETVGQQAWYAIKGDYSEQKCVYYDDWYLNNVPLS